MSRFPAKFGFRSILAPCLPEDIAAAEQQLRMKLPVDYRAFLEEWNGGSFASFPKGDDFEGSPAVPFVNDVDEFGAVGWLYGVGPHWTSAHLLDNRDGYAFRERVPDNIIAIGEETRAPKLCISMAGDDSGKIYYWDPGVDFEEGDNVQTYDYLNLVADCFEECWQKLLVPRAIW